MSRFEDGRRKYGLLTAVLVIWFSVSAVAVPTHFAKVVLTSRSTRRGLPGSSGPSSSSTTITGADSSLTSSGGGVGGPKEYSIGAFVLPNEPIPDETPLTRFVVPVDAVESSSGLSLFPQQLKNMSQDLCKVSPR